MKHADLISQMTLEEKVAFCSGSDYWHTASIERLGIPSILWSDGPHGIRNSVGTHDKDEPKKKDKKGEGMDALLGGFAVGGGLLLIVLLYEKVRQKEAMGGGDIKLLFLTGLFLGWQRNILCLLIACVLGIVFAFIFPEKRTTEDEAEEEDGKLFPWGPSISAAAILTLLCGSEIIGVYLSLF